MLREITDSGRDRRISGPGVVAGLAVIVMVGVLAGCRKTTAWSPDGKLVAVEAYGGIQLYDTVAGTFRRLLPGEPRKHEALAPAWAPDSRTLGFFDAQGGKDGAKVSVTASLVSVDVSTGKRTPLVAGIATGGGESQADDPITPVRDTCAAAWSSDGREIVYVAPEGARSVLWVVAASGGAPRRLTPKGRQSAAPAWSPDSRWIACASAAVGDAAVWELELLERDGTGRRTLCRAPAGHTLASGLQWQPDGKAAGLLFERSEKAENAPPACEFWSVSIADGVLRKVVDVPAPAWSVSFTPDLSTVVFLQEIEGAAGQKTATVAVLEPPYVRPRLLAHPTRYENPGVSIPMLSPDGRAVSIQIQEGEKPLLLGLRYLDGRPPVDVTISK